MSKDAAALACPHCHEPIEDWYRTQCSCCGRRYKRFCADPSLLMENYREARDCPHVKAEVVP